MIGISAINFMSGTRWDDWISIGFLIPLTVKRFQPLDLDLKNVPAVKLFRRENFAG